MQVTRGEKVEVVPQLDGTLTLPSVVSFLEGGKFLVGHAAKK
jgi:molecular chaperone DnaK (HSP70)